MGTNSKENVGLLRIITNHLRTIVCILLSSHLKSLTSLSLLLYSLTSLRFLPPFQCNKRWPIMHPLWTLSRNLAVGFDSSFLGAKNFGQGFSNFVCIH